MRGDDGGHCADAGLDDAYSADGGIVSGDVAWKSGIGGRIGVDGDATAVTGAVGS